jgi:UDP-glucose 4-epimerase
MHDRGLALLTGATGFLGPYVVAALKASGWRVRAALRRERDSYADESIVVGPIGAQTQWATALAGVDVAVHLAGLAHQPRLGVSQNAAFAEINTAGSLRLAEAAAGRIEHLVFVSTALVNGAITDGREPFRETDGLQPQTAYARSKAEAEVALTNIASRTGLLTTIVRPPLIYGRGAKGNFGLLVKAVRSGIPIPVRHATNKRALVAAENAASFIAHSLANPTRASGTFFVADECEVSTAELVRLIARSSGHKAALSAFPSESLLRFIGQKRLADSLFRSFQIDRSRMYATGWKPIVSLEEGLQHALVQN